MQIIIQLHPRFLFAALLTFFSLTGFSVLHSQSAIKWENTVFDFGDIRQNDSAKTTFVFKNITNKPIRLQDVKAACGCTTPEWSKDEIAPGKNGAVSASYGTQRVGEFSKTISVFVEGAEKPEVITIRGIVFPRNSETFAEGPEGEMYRQQLLRFRFQHSFVYLDKELGFLDSELQSGEFKRVDFNLANYGTRIVKFFHEPQDSQDVIVGFSFTELRPGEEGQISVIMDGKKFNQRSSGPFERIGKVKTDLRGSDEILEFTVKGQYRKIISPQQLLDSPRIIFESKSINLGKIAEGDFIEHEFHFKNEGRSTLIIEEVISDCGCTAAAFMSKEIAAGQSSFIKMTFDSRGRPGIQEKKITVRTNDVHDPEILLEFKAEVEGDPFHEKAPNPAGE